MQVFSQWQGALFLVSKALDAQDPPIKHVALTGTRHRGQASTHPHSPWMCMTADLKAICLMSGELSYLGIQLQLRSGKVNICSHQKEVMKLSYVHIKQHLPNFTKCAKAHNLPRLCSFQTTLSRQHTICCPMCMCAMHACVQGPREVIKTFNDKADVRVFLLTRGQGAAGLTLTQGAPPFMHQSPNIPQTRP